MGSDARGGGLALNLSSLPRGRRATGMGELVFQVRGDDVGSQSPSSKWSSNATSRWTMRDARVRCVPYYAQISEQQIVNRDVVRNTHLQRSQFWVD